MSLVAILAAGYLSWATLLFFMQRSMMFPGRDLLSTGGAADTAPPGVVQLWIPSSTGEVEAWLVASHDSGRSPAVILAHGNAELIGDGLAEARMLTDLGLSVLLVEYPGYGRSAGQPSRRTIGEVFLAAYDTLAARPDIDADRIVGMGRSLGGGAITDLARHRAFRALVLQSTFTSIADLARRYLVPGWLARDAFDNLAVVRSFPGPVLLIHGMSDMVIAHSNSERLARAAAAAELLSLDCGHNDCVPELYRTGLKDFLVRAEVLPRGTEAGR